MPNETGGADDQSVEIRLDEHIPPVQAVTVTRKKKRAPKPRPIFPPQRPVKGTLGHSTRQLLNEKAAEMYSDDESVYLSDKNEEVVDPDEPIGKSDDAPAPVITASSDALQSSNDKREEYAKSQSSPPPLPKNQSNSGNDHQVLAGLPTLGSRGSPGIESAPRAPLEAITVPSKQPKSRSADDGYEIATDAGLTPAGLASLGATEDIESTNATNDKGDAVGEVASEPSKKRKRLLICIVLLLVLIVAIVVGVVASGGDSDDGESSSIAKSPNDDGPTAAVTNLPSFSPTASLSTSPSTSPSSVPSTRPTLLPTLSASPTATPVPTFNPSSSPSSFPSTLDPSTNPSSSPSFTPSMLDPSANPSSSPTFFPSTSVPSVTPTIVRSVGPTALPSSAPSATFTIPPTLVPSPAPTVPPTSASSSTPSIAASERPTRTPTIAPSASPSGTPTVAPSANPTGDLTRAPTTSTEQVWINNLLPFFGDSFPSTQLQRTVLNQLAQTDNWAPNDTSDSRLWMERFVLSVFYESCGGSGWNLSSGWRNRNLSSCNWFGVSCDSSNRVVSLLSQFNGLSNSLPSEIGLLGELTRLGLQTNRLQGNIPTEIGRLTKLASLDLRNNRLEGRVPAAVENLAVSSGTSILLGGNQLVCTNSISNLDC